MHRGTTPTHLFKLPKEIASISPSKIYVTYAQNEKTIVEKDIDSVVFQDGLISVPLTQAETLMFQGGEVEVQIRIKDTDNNAYTTFIVTVPVHRILKDGEI